LSLSPVRVALLTCLSLLAFLARADDAGDPLFQTNDVLEATLTAPLGELGKERDAEYLEATFELHSEGGESQVFDAKIRPRGHLRLETCKLPPLWLNLRKSQVKGTLFHKQNKLKLVVHCGDTIRYEQAVLREYLAYRILNLLTPQSFRVRLLRLRYIDSTGERDEQVRYAFLLEHKDRLGKRIGAKNPKLEETALEGLAPDHLNLTSLYQYLIGNTDFSPIAPAPYDECCHNYELFERKGAELLIAIPYDFDQSGFVNAPYAIPAEQFRIETVRERVFRGRCVNNAHIDASIARFQEVRDEIFRLLETHEGMTKMTRSSLLRYVNMFYKIIDDPRKVEDRIMEKCI
jgi:hypothetical protein